VIYGPLFNTPIPDKVEGFTLEDTDKRKMEEIWPAGTQAAQDVGISVFFNFPSY
jgi:deoxyribodipyrimidine photo-lyase